MYYKIINGKFCFSKYVNNNFMAIPGSNVVTETQVTINANNNVAYVFFSTVFKQCKIND